jgi:hypothetical protein
LEQPSANAFAEQAYAILRNHCYRCHGENGSAKGGMNYVLDRERLIQSGKVVAGRPDASPLLEAIKERRMPPPGSPPLPDENSIRTLEAWIAAGAPSWSSQREPSWISQAQILEHILKDLMTMDRRARRFQRYFTLTHLHNAGASTEDLELHRQAISKLMNSLSWHPKITRPVAIDPDQTVLRIDLRDFQWDANLWNRLLAEYPYGVTLDTWTGRAVCVATASRMPILRGDWFIATASRPPLYHDLLQLPTTAAELERQLRVDAAQNILQERVARAGFMDSGVSRNNRMIERHYAVHGAYWRTYDFEAVPQNFVERQNLLPDRRNLFAFPLGPGFAERTFQHAGGEIIFNLPNGLHAFMLVDALGNRIDKGPLAIVSDPKRPDRAVETGVSCFSCHVTGILFKDDQIRDHVAKNRAAFSVAEAELISTLYPPRATMRKLMTEDADRYRQAVEKTGAGVSDPEPIHLCTLRHESPLGLKSAAAEIDLRPHELAELVRRVEPLNRSLGGLAIAGGSVSRELFAQLFADLVHAAGKGRVGSLTSLGILSETGSDVDPLEDSAGPANASVFTPDGRFVLFACADKSIVVWDVLRNLEARRLVGHTASVWAVAVSPDGREAASGSADGSVRLWDLETGQERLQIHRHAGPVSCVVFAQDGQTLAVGGFDGKVLLLRRSDGAEVQRFDSRLPFVSSVTEVGQQRRRFLVAGGRMPERDDSGGSNSPPMFHTAGGKAVVVATSRDGRVVVSGGEDGVVRIYDAETDAEAWCWHDHRTSVTAASVFAAQGCVLSGSSTGTVVARDIRSGAILNKHLVPNEQILAVFLTPDGRYLLAATGNRRVHWLPMHVSQP